MTAMRKASFWLVALVLVSACSGEEEDGPENYACRYETRHSACNQSAPTGAFTAGCFQFDANDYNISPSQVCTNVTRNGSSCSATCCVVTEYRNASLTSGNC